MVVLLLVLIVLIMLFGAGAVKGWLKGLALRLAGVSILALAFVALTLWLGETGVWLAMGGLAILLLVLKAIVGEPDSPAKKAARQRATDASWAEWKIANAKPEVRFSEHRLSKGEKKLRKNEYLDR